MAAHDRTFHAESRIGTAKWVATALGMSIDEFRKNLGHLQRAADFPAEDPLLGGWIKSAVIDWIENRRNLGQAAARDRAKREGVNRDAI